MTRKSITHDLPFACRCGAVTGSLTEAGPGVGDHVVCHCVDCQAFARHLGAGDRVLDEHAGTALYQGRCATLRLHTGRERLASLHLTDKPTLRWYARCCDTPLFNTYRNGRVPVLTTFVANYAPDRRAALGPPVGHLFLHEATGDVRHLKPLSTAGILRRFLPRMVRDIVTGARRRSPLFDPRTLEPVVAPEKVAG
jgi:hypothetical protein